MQMHINRIPLNYCNEYTCDPIVRMQKLNLLKKIRYIVSTNRKSMRIYGFCTIEMACPDILTQISLFVKMISSAMEKSVLIFFFWQSNTSSLVLAQSTF